MLDFLVTFGVMSLVMSTVIILLLALQKPIKKRFTPLSRYIIWTVIIIRLCIPVGLGIMPELFTVSVTEQPEPVIITEDYQDRVLAELVVEGKTDYVPPSVEAYIEEHPEIIEESKSFKLTKESMLTATLILWLTGAAVFVTVTLIRYFISIARLTRGLGAPTPELESIYDSVCTEMLLKRKPKLYVSQNATSPMLCGFVRTKVLLPDIDIGEESLRYILCHELTHYKRGDLYIKLAAMLANALQWFNPLVYIACGKMSEEAELSCDAAVLTKTDLTGGLDYGNSMLEIVKHCKTAPGLTTGFNPQKKAVKERFENIIDTSKRKKAVAILIAVLVIALVCTSIIGCTTKHKSGVVQGLDDVTVEQQETADPTGEYIDMNEIEEQRIKEGKFHVKVDQWHTESEDWKLYYDFDAETLVLEHTDGRRFAYGDEAEGVHTLSPAYKHGEDLGAYSWIIGDYIVINYRLPREGKDQLPPEYLAIVDLKDGGVKAVHTKRVDEILELHGLDRDFLIPFKDWNGSGMLGYSYSFYPMGNEDSTDISLYTSLTFDGATYSLNCVTCFDKNTGRLGETSATKLYPDDPDPIDEWERRYALMPEDITRIEGVRNNDGAHIFSAFLNKDIAYLEDKAGYPKGTLNDYKTLRFGDHVFAEEKFGGSNDLLLYVEITESGIEGLEAGRHRFIYLNRNGREYLLHHCPHYTGDSYQTPASSWLNYSNDPMLPSTDNYTDDDFWAMTSMLRYGYHAKSIEEFSQLAKTVFGVELDLSGYTLGKLYDGIERYGYREEKSYQYSEVEFGDGYVVIQFYADYGLTIPAYKIRYNYHEIEMTDGGRTFEEHVFDGPALKYDDTGREAIYTVG